MGLASRDSKYENGEENEEEREGDTHQTDMEFDIQNERNWISPRQNIDEEKRVKISCKS